MGRYTYADVISYQYRLPVLSSHFMQLTKTLKAGVQKGKVMIGYEHSRHLSKDSGLSRTNHTLEL